jgi:hypothetical protein
MPTAIPEVLISAGALRIPLVNFQGLRSIFSSHPDLLDWISRLQQPFDEILEGIPPFEARVESGR